MYKILLADEEGVALRSLRAMIDKEHGEDCDIRLAANSVQFFDIFPKFVPDLIFLNVQMNGIHGLNTIRELHNKNKQAQFIIVSFHNRVDFGTPGSYLGIYGYMQKPFKSDILHPLLKSCLAHISSEQKRNDILAYNKQKWDEAIPMLEGGMINELLFPDSLSHTENILTYKQFLNIEPDHYWLCDLKYSQITEHGTMCNPIGSMVLLTGSQLYFRKIVKAFFPSAIVGAILANHVVFLVPSRSSSLTEDEKKIRDKRATDLCYQLHRKLNLRFRHEIIRETETLPEFPKKRDQLS